jgi:haloalkane dehalogenase
LSELYPFRTSSLDLDNEQMSYVDAGDPGATPVLLLHGNPTWSFLFRKMIPHIAERRRVVAPDMVGFGLSSKPASAGYHSLERHAQNLARLIDVLRLRRLTLVLHDFGGPVGLNYAVAHADNVERIVLVNSWLEPLPAGLRPRLPFALRLASSDGVGEFLDSAFNLSVNAGLARGASQRLPQPVLKAYQFPFRPAGSQIAARAFTRLLSKSSEVGADALAAAQQRLRQIEAPVHIFSGTRDTMLGKAPAYLLRDSFKNAKEPIFVDSASHLLPEGQPELLLTAVLEESKPPIAAPTLSGLKIIS